MSPQYNSTSNSAEVRQPWWFLSRHEECCSAETLESCEKKMIEDKVIRHFESTLPIWKEEMGLLDEHHDGIISEVMFDGILSRFNTAGDFASDKIASLKDVCCEEGYVDYIHFAKLLADLSGPHSSDGSIDNDNVAHSPVSGMEEASEVLNRVSCTLHSRQQVFLDRCKEIDVIGLGSLNESEFRQKQVAGSSGCSAQLTLLRFDWRIESDSLFDSG